MKILLLDKDGTIARTKSGRPFVNKPWDQEFIEGAKEAIERYQSKGWKIAIISNQGGVIAGYKSLESTFMEMQFILELFDSRGVDAYFCPDNGETCWRVWGDCSEDHRILYDDSHSLVQELGISGQLRKPGVGMLKLAIDVANVDNYFDVLYVGDRPEDSQAAFNAKVKFMDAATWRKSS